MDTEIESSSVAELDERVEFETAAASASTDLVPIVGANLRRLRTKRGLSLERLSKLSGVSRAMLSQVELAYSAPTINVIWRIAHALEVPFGALLTIQDGQQPAQVLRSRQSKLLTSHDGSFSSRALFPFDGPRRSEFYELRLLGHGLERAAAHPLGTTENIVVVEGSVVITAGDGEPERLDAGDAILFQADVPHSYQNPSAADTLMYLVMQYTEEIGS